MKKRIISMILAAVMLLTVTACGSGGQSDAGGSPSAAVTAGPAGPSLSAGSAATPEPDYRLSKVLSAGTTIWYELDDDNNPLGKDSYLYTIYVLHPDGTFIFAPNQKRRLGELAQMEDADIIAMVEEEYQAMVDYEIREKYSGFLERQFVTNFINDFTCGGFFREQYVLAEEGIIEFINYFLSKRRFKIDAEIIESAVAAALKEYGPAAEAATKATKGNYWNILLDYAIECEYHENVPEFSEFCSNLIWSPDAPTVASLGTLYNALNEMAKSICSVINEEANTQAEAARLNTGCQYKLSIATDSTGNYTQSVKLWLDVPVKDRIYEFTLSQRGMGDFENNFEVYDSIYAGFALRGGMDSFSDILYTRVNENVFFQLDDVATSGLPVDVEAKDLFG